MRHIHFDTIDSTSTYARKLVAETKGLLTEPVLVTAEEQTAGRGRCGKSFSSRRGNGLYMTVAFPTGRRPQDCLFVTVAAAVAVCEVLAGAGCPDAKIKWVNDIYVDDRKVCGILTEAVTDPDTGIMNCCLIGVGINIDADMETFPEELREKAGSLHGLRYPKEMLADRIAGQLIGRAGEVLESDQKKQAILDIYRENSMILGRKIRWEENGEEQSGTAREIDEQANLIVETPGGRKKLDSGYISVLFR